MVVIGLAVVAGACCAVVNTWGGWVGAAVVEGGVVRAPSRVGDERGRGGRRLLSGWLHIQLRGRVERSGIGRRGRGR
jgi:hypothetical protein